MTASAASLLTKAFFKDASNVIFWRDAADADRLGAILAGEKPALPAQIRGAGPKVAGLSATDAFEAVLAKIADAPVTLDPTPHWYANEVFPANFYAELMARMPSPSDFTSITEMGWAHGDAGTESERGVLEFSSEALGRLDPELAAFWHDVAQQFRSEQFAQTMLRKFRRRSSNMIVFSEE